MTWAALTAAQYVLAVGLLVLLLGTYQPPPEVEPAPEAVEFEGQRALELVRELATGFPNRVTGTPEDEAAARWVADQFRALGLEPVEQRYRVWGTLDPSGADVRQFDGINVLAISPGETERAIVIGAHRDIVPQTTQGAVDNASGTGTMLELARVLVEEPRRYTYVFASWGAEEVGLGGSRYYVGRPLRPTVLALSLDVTGLVSGRTLMLVDWTSLSLEAALLVEQLGMEEGLLRRPRERGLLALTGLTVLTDGGATDSTPFAVRGIPALGIGWEGSRAIIHTERDTIEQVDAESLELAGRVAERLVRAAEARPDRFLDAPGLYLRRADGQIVSDLQVVLAGLVLAAFALANPLLAVLRLRAVERVAPVRAHAPLLGACLVGAAVVAGLPWLLGLWRGPDAVGFGVYGGLSAVGLVPAAFAGPRLSAVSPLEARLVLNALIAAAFLAVAALANVFLAALLLGYPLLALSRMTFLQGRRWRALDTVLLLPWAGLALGLVAVSQLYASLTPEFAPPVQPTLFQGLVALLLYYSVASSFRRTDSGVRGQATSGAG